MSANENKDDINQDCDDSDNNSNDDIGDVVEAFELVFRSKKLFGMISMYCSVYVLQLLRLVSRQFNAIGSPILFDRAYFHYYDYEFNYSDYESNDWIKPKARRLYISRRFANHPLYITPPITHLEFSSYESAVRIPNSVTTIYFSPYFNKDVDNLPSSLECIVFGDNFNRCIDNLPASLLYLTLSTNFDQPINKLPPSLLHLKFTKRCVFNQPIESSLPSSLQRLEFGKWYNKSIRQLPNNLKFLATGTRFQKIEYLPNSLTSLILGDEFNYPLDCLPPNLRVLSLGARFNQPLILPDSIIYLSFGKFFNRPITFPPSLKYLQLGSNFSQPITQFPDSLNNLVLMSRSVRYFKLLTPSIKLSFFDTFNEPINDLPYSITHLLLGWSFSKAVDNLPNSITHLTFGFFFNEPVEHLPDSITHLKFGYYFNQPLEHLPNSITHLYLGRCFNQSIAYLPISITHLTVASMNTPPFEDLLRFCSLTHLAFCLKTPTICHLPQSVTHISLRKPHHALFCSLPRSIKALLLVGVKRNNILQYLQYPQLKEICMVRLKFGKHKALAEFGFFEPD